MRIVLDILLLIFFVLFTADLVRNIVMIFKAVVARKRKRKVKEE